MAKKSNAARFPVARIKKLIQADEDVGKVAQGTPVVVCAFLSSFTTFTKALELFLASLVAECVKDATERGSKKITAYGLKRTITATPTFDFCADIVAGVADPITADEDADNKAAKKKRVRKPKAAVEGEEGEDGEEKPKPKRKRAPAKPKVPKVVKKAESDDGEGEGEAEAEGGESEPLPEEEEHDAAPGPSKVDDEDDYGDDDDEMDDE
ncbi:hypothetical protein RQP46_006525 [Phenoliferia psychrophenolica]